MGNRFIEEGIAQAETMAIDRKMFEAQGPKWHKKDREKGRVPDNLRNVDTDSTWGKSKYRGWVQGYGLDLAVTAVSPPYVPIWAEGNDLTFHENKAAQHFAAHIPDTTRYVLADEGYDDNKLRETINIKQGRGYSRRLVVPMKQFPNTAEDRFPHIQFYKSKKGKEIYSTRKISVEPAFDIINGLFDLEPVWMKGKKNVFPLLLLSVSTCLVMMYFNHVNDRPVSNLKYILAVF